MIDSAQANWRMAAVVAPLIVTVLLLAYSLVAQLWYLAALALPFFALAVVAVRPLHPEPNASPGRRFRAILALSGGTVLLSVAAAALILGSIVLLLWLAARGFQAPHGGGSSD